MNHDTILLAFVVVMGLAILLQTIMLLAILVAARKAASTIQEETEKMRTAVMPVIYDTRDLLASTQGILASTQDILAATQGFINRVGPRIEAATTDLAEISHGLRVQSAEIQSSVLEIVGHARQQGERVDDMISHFLDTVDRAGGFVMETVRKPVQQVSGVLRSVKAIVESLRGPYARR
jgi:ABC-type transporter Mla subunit MlaD